LDNNNRASSIDLTELSLRYSSFLFHLIGILSVKPTEKDAVVDYTKNQKNIKKPNLV
jgi:hypothetical protein